MISPEQWSGSCGVDRSFQVWQLCCGFVGLLLSACGFGGSWVVFSEASGLIYRQGSNGQRGCEQRGC